MIACLLNKLGQTLLQEVHSTIWVNMLEILQVSDEIEGCLRLTESRRLRQSDNLVESIKKLMTIGQSVDSRWTVGGQSVDSRWTGWIVQQQKLNRIWAHKSYFKQIINTIWLISELLELVTIELKGLFNNTLIFWAFFKPNSIVFKHENKFFQEERNVAAQPWLGQDTKVVWQWRQTRNQVSPIARRSKARA